MGCWDVSSASLSSIVAPLCGSNSPQVKLTVNYITLRTGQIRKTLPGDPSGFSIGPHRLVLELRAGALCRAPDELQHVCLQPSRRPRDQVPPGRPRRGALRLRLDRQRRRLDAVEHTQGRGRRHHGQPGAFPPDLQGVARRRGREDGGAAAVAALFQPAAAEAAALPLALPGAGHFDGLGGVAQGGDAAAARAECFTGSIMDW